MSHECILNIIRDICCCVCFKKDEVLQNVRSEPNLPVQSQPQRSQLIYPDYTQQVLKVEPRHSNEGIIAPHRQSTKTSSHQIKPRNSDENIIVPHRQSTQISTHQVKPRHFDERTIVPQRQSTQISTHQFGHSNEIIIAPHRLSTQISTPQVKPGQSNEIIIAPHRLSTQISTPQVKPGQSNEIIIAPHRQSTQISTPQVKAGQSNERINVPHRQSTQISIHQTITINIDISTILKVIDLEVPHWTNSTLGCLTNRFSNEWRGISKDFGVRKTVVLDIESINRIQDRLMFCQYLLRKEELINRYGKEGVVERRLYHGTTLDSTVSIVETNFDWRFCGLNDSSNFGRGVYFSPNAVYASNYGKEYSILILSRVLIGPSIEGTRQMKLPPYGYQCTRKRDGIEYILYNDDEFYPEFLIVYKKRPKI